PAGIQGDRRPDEIEIALIPVAPGPEPRRHVRDDDLLRADVPDPYLLRDPEMAPYRMERAEKMGMVRTAREFRAHLREGLRCARVVVVEKQYVAAAGLRHDPVALGMSPIPGGAMFGIFDPRVQAVGRLSGLRLFSVADDQQFVVRPELGKNLSDQPYQ